MRILEIIMQTNDLNETENFYTNKLQLELVEKKENTISFMAGETKLTFEKTTHNENPHHHLAFNIPLNKLEEAMKWADHRFELVLNQEQGYVTTFDKWKAKSFYFYDNNNNLAEFIIRTDLNNHSDEAFSSKNILNVSEIGIVSDKPLELAEQIVKQTGIDYFSKESKLENLVALGDDNGLLIIVSPNRNWYPTDRKAEKQKLSIRIKTDETEITLHLNEQGMPSELSEA
ncbi:TPA: VOC family protein [Elizabethkingia meningoseptica]